jgi:hypothetical protein
MNIQKRNSVDDARSFSQGTALGQTDPFHFVSNTVVWITLEVYVSLNGFTSIISAI